MQAYKLQKCCVRMRHQVALKFFTYWKSFTAFDEVATGMANDDEIFDVMHRSPGFINGLTSGVTRDFCIVLTQLFQV